MVGRKADARFFIYTLKGMEECFIGNRSKYQGIQDVPIAAELRLERMPPHKLVGPILRESWTVTAGPCPPSRRKSIGTKIIWNLQALRPVLVPGPNTFRFI